MSSDPTNCPECGAALAASLAGLCPRCVWGDSMAPPDSEGLIPGCELGPEIARGGMGIVYAARQFSPRRDVAVKMLRPHLLEQAAMKERFRQEAQAAAALQHPGILPVYQVGETDGVPWFTMMLAEGGTLSARRADYAGKWRESAALIAGLAQAVGHAHERGVLHRDLKPGNILFDADDRAYVCDFGLAKVATAGETTPDWTLSVQLLGTPHYLPPEVAAGTMKLATTSGDIYALGVILYELLAGRLPFDAENVPALLRKIADEDPSTLSVRRSDLSDKSDPSDTTTTAKPPPPDLAAIAMKCLEKSPERRYATTAALADDLNAWLAGKPVTARRLTRRQKVGRWVRRNPVVAVLSVFLALSVITAAVLLMEKNVRLARSLQTSRRLDTEALANLGASLLNQARLLLYSRTLGHREEAVALIRQAARQQVNAATVTIASTALASLDLHVQHRWPVEPGSRPVISPSFNLWTTVSTTASDLTVRRVTDNSVFAVIPVRGTLRCLKAIFADDLRLALSYHDLRPWFRELTVGDLSSASLDQYSDLAPLTEDTIFPDFADLDLDQTFVSVNREEPMSLSLAVTLANDARQIRRYFGPGEEPSQACAAPDGQWSAFVMKKGSPVDISYGGRDPIATLPGVWFSVAASHDSRWLLTSGPPGFRIWCAESWQPVFDVPRTTPILSSAVASFSRDGTVLALKTTEDGVSLYELPSFRKLRDLIMPQRLTVRGIALTRDARNVCVLSPNLRVHCWDLDQLDAELARLGLPTGPASQAPIPPVPAKPVSSFRPFRP